MIKFLMTVAIVFGLSFAEAKSKVQSMNYSAIPFNWATFQKLSSQDQLSYVKGYIDFFEKIDAQNRSAKNKTSSLWESFLILEAHAADYFCFNGGLAYMAPSQADCAAGKATPASSSPELFGCGADEQRCSLVFGVSAAGKGFCYNTKSNGSNTATRQCRLASEKAGGAKRMTDALATCNGATPNPKCGALRAALEADTAKLEEYCKSGTHKKACEAMQNRNNAINGRKPATPPASAPTAAKPAEGQIQGRFCSQIESNLKTDAISKLVGPVDGLWAQVMDLSSSGACDANMNFSDVIKKMGVCSSTSSRTGRTSLSNDEAIRIIKSATRHTPGSGTPEENSARVADNDKFEDQFGVSPSEFREIFCTPKTREDFLKKFDERVTKTLSSRTPVDDPARSSANPRGALRGQLTLKGYENRQRLSGCFDDAKESYDSIVKKNECRRVAVKANDDSSSLGKIMIFNPKTKSCVLSNGEKTPSSSCKNPGFSVGLINEDGGRAIGSECVSALATQQIYKFECTKNPGEWGEQGHGMDVPPLVEP